MLSKLRPRERYVRIFLLQGIVFTIVVMFFSFFLVQKFSDFAVKEIDHFVVDRMMQVSNNTELTLQKLRLYGINMYEDRHIANWINQETDNPASQRDASASVMKYLTTQSFIDSAYLINFNMKEVMTSDYGIYRFADFHDQVMLNRVQFNRTHLLEFFYHKVDGKPYLALIIPSQPSDVLSNGYLVLLFDKAGLQSFLLSPSEKYKNQMLMVDSAGNPMLGNIDADAIKKVRQLDEDKLSEGYEFQMNGIPWVVRSSVMQTEGWTFYHFLPQELMREKTVSLKRLVLWTSFTMILILLFFLFWISRHNYKPFSELVKHISNKLSPHSADIIKIGMKNNEVGLIKLGVESLVDKVEQMQQSILHNQQMIKEENIRLWILNGNLNEPAKQFLQKETKLLDSPFIRLAVARIEAYSQFKEKYSFSSRKLFKYAMGNIAQEILNKAQMYSEPLDMGGDHIVVLFSSDQQDNGAVIDLWQEIKEQIEKYVQIGVSVSVSDNKSHGDNLQFIYDMVYELSMVKFIHGEDRIYHEGDMEAYANEPIDEELLNELIHSVRLRNAEETTRTLRELMSYMQSISYEECKLQLTRILYSLMKAFKQIDVFQNLSGIQSFLDRFGTLKEAQDWLERQLLEIVAMSNEKVTDRQEEVVGEIIEYVHHHFQNPMLTNEEIAEHVALSSDYIRRLFKNSNRLSLTEYILEKRLQHAKHLLKTTGLTVSAIAEQSGFQTMSHFFRAFKKDEKMTPNQYREQYL